jgi:hypothetical protein
MTKAPQAQKAKAAKPAETDRSGDTATHPFLVKTLITFTKRNDAGVEHKHKETVVFKLTAKGGSMPWYVLRNYLVPRYLIKKFGPQEVGWDSIYEIQIVKQVNRNQPDDITDIPLRIMTLDQLELYCQRWELNVPVREFYSVEKAREMVSLRMEDEKGYQKHLAEYREGKKRSYPELDAERGMTDPETVPESEFDKVDMPADTKKKKKEKTEEPMSGGVVLPEDSDGIFKEM